MIEAPFTDAQVANLNRWQHSEVHPFTCGGGHDKAVVLVATNEGWVCPEGCGYTQNWAHASMARGYETSEEFLEWLDRAAKEG